MRDDDTGAAPARRRDAAGLPPLWLGCLVALLTVVGVVVSVRDGSSATAEAAAPGSSGTTAGTSTSDTSTAGTIAPSSSTPADTTPATSPATSTPVDPVLVAGASIPPLADLVRQVGGGRVEVVSVVPQGVDGHTYEPTPSDVADLARADAIFVASVDLNPSVTRTAQANLRPGAITVDLMAATVPEVEVIADRTHSHGSGGAHSHANVHVWTDPLIALRWVDEIRQQLSLLDPEGADQYATNAAAYSARLQALHEATVAATATVPEAARTLVVYHDSWSYFGRTYGYRVLGALQAADFAEPSAAEVRDMVEQVRAAGVPAFFGAAVFPTEVLERVSEEAGVPYVADLADDELPGDPGDAEHGYLGMMVANVRHIVTSLGGDASALDGLVP